MIIKYMTLADNNVLLKEEVPVSEAIIPTRGSRVQLVDKSQLYEVNSLVYQKVPPVSCDVFVYLCPINLPAQSHCRAVNADKQ